MTPRNQKTFWGTADVCAEFGIHRNTVANWERKGVIPKAIHVEGRKVWVRAKLVEFFERLAG